MKALDDMIQKDASTSPSTSNLFSESQIPPNKGIRANILSTSYAMQN